MRLLGFLALIALVMAGCGRAQRAGQRPSRLSGGALAEAATGRGSLTLRPAAPPRVLPPDFLGFNAEALTASSGVWSDPRFLAAAARLRPETLRIFGGTTANYWDWRRGTFVVGSVVPTELAAARSRVHLPLALWARVIARTGARPLFDLNLVTASLANQLSMLSAARRLGLPVERIELGNELYLPRYAGLFPTGAAYGRVATRWIRAIRTRFPRVRIAVSAYLPADLPGIAPTARERGWNDGLRATVRGADALAFHPYFRSGLPDTVAPRAGRAAAAVVGAPWRRFAAVRESALRGLGPGMQAWMTEWNLFDRRAPVHGTWSQGLAVAAFGLDLLSDRRIAQADAHALVASAPFASIFADANGLSFGPLLPTRPRRSADPGPHATAAAARGPGVAQVAGFTVPDRQPPATVRFGLSASGVAMSELLDAMRGSDRAQPVSMSPLPSEHAPSRLASLPGGGAAQQGALLRGPGHWTLLLVNLDRRPVGVRTAGLGPGRASYEQLHANPDTPVAGPASLERRRGRLPRSATLVLAPYSLTRVWGR
jgi:hypothetical protein